MSDEAPVTPRKSPRQARARATVDAIVLATAHILRTEGAEGLTTNRIARLAGVSIGSVYQYFPNKHAIVAELRSRHGDWFHEETHRGIERGAALPLRAGVRASIARMVALHRVDPELHREISGAPHPLTPEQWRAYRERTALYLREHEADLRPVDPDLAAVVVTRAAEALVHGLGLEEPEWLAHPAFVDEVTELVVGYLARRA